MIIIEGDHVERVASKGANHIDKQVESGSDKLTLCPFDWIGNRCLVDLRIYKGDRHTAFG